MKNLKKSVCFDIDNVICKTVKSNYIKSKPIKKNIKFINHLYYQGHTIKIFTARYMGRTGDNAAGAKKKAKKITLNQLLDRGVNTWPCIKSIIKKDGIKITINENNFKDIILNNGDTVNRTIMDGDYVLFNRQPSLHKMSMMAHRVKVMKGNTFRLNVSVTPPYNADFDGDEMNMHVPQSISSMCELRNLVSVNYQIISPRENKPIITVVQDTLLGINKFTKSEKINPIDYNGYHYSENTNIYPINKKVDDSEYIDSTTYLNHSQLMNIICNLSTFNGILPDPTITISPDGKEIQLWSGRDILSYIFSNRLL